MSFHSEIPYDSSRKPTNTSYIVTLEFDGDPGGDWLYEAIQRRLMLDRGQTEAKLTGIRVVKK